MSILQRALVVALALGVLAFTVELIRRRRLREEYSLLWILTGIVILAFALFPRALYMVSELLGLHHLTTMLLITFLFLLTIVLHYSTVISQHAERETQLAQRLAILEWKLRLFKEAKGPAAEEKEDMEVRQRRASKRNSG